MIKRLGQKIWAEIREEVIHELTLTFDDWITERINDAVERLKKKDNEV